MSLWTIEREQDQVKLTYTHEPLAPNPLIQPCGACEPAVETDLEAWVVEQAKPWDVIATPRGTFVRLRPIRDERPTIASGTQDARA